MNTTDRSDHSGASPELAVGAGFGAQEPRYAWQIELVAEREDEDGFRVRFEGTHAEASRKADRLADSAPYEVRECILHRCGNLSPNTEVK
jgi:hypothetical protein